MPAFSRFLRYFLSVGRNGSIRRAAEELHVSASAIDRQLLNVEAALGIPLFERIPTGLHLTAAGEIMMAAGNDWLKSLAAVRGQIEDLRGLRRGHVDIAVIDALADGFIPRIIGQIRTDYPGITMAIRVLDNLQVRDAIATGEVDLGIYLEPQAYRDLDVRARADAVLGFVMLPDGDMADRSHCVFSEVSDRKLVVPAEPLALCRQVAVLADATGVEIRIGASSDNIQMIKSLVMQGAGIGILTSLDVIGEVARGALQFVAITDAVVQPMTLALCTASSRSPSLAADLVLTAIEDQFEELDHPSIDKATRTCPAAESIRQPLAATHFDPWRNT